MIIKLNLKINTLVKLLFYYGIISYVFFSFFIMSNDIIKIIVMTLLLKYEIMNNLFGNSYVNKLFIWKKNPICFKIYYFLFSVCW